MTNETDKAALAALIAGAEGARIAAFLHASGTGFAPNPFPQSTAGAVRHVAEGNALEYPMRGIATAGLPDLLQAVRALPTSTPLARHILKSEDSAHTCYVYLDGAGAFVGAFLHGKPDMPLPPFAPAPAPAPAPAKPAAARRRPRWMARQLDLFAGTDWVLPAGPAQSA